MISLIDVCNIYKYTTILIFVKKYTKVFDLRQKLTFKGIFWVCMGIIHLLLYTLLRIISVKPYTKLLLKFLMDMIINLGKNLGHWNLD